jgi:purine-cytosine permease-like protein
MLGAFGFFEQFSSFIGGIAAVIPPLAGPMIADFWIVHRTKYEVKYLDQLPEINIPSVIAASVGIIATLMCTGFPTLGLQPVAFLAQPWIVPSILGVIVSVVMYLATFYVFKALGIHSGYSKAIENEGVNQETALTGNEEDNMANVNI